MVLGYYSCHDRSLCRHHIESTCRRHPDSHYYATTGTVADSIDMAKHKKAVDVACQPMWRNLDPQDVLWNGIVHTGDEHSLQLALYYTG